MNKIEEYVLNKYPIRFKNKPVLIKEFDSHYEVNHNKDASPLILGKKTIYMKENKLIEMSNKIDTMGNVLNRIIQELNTLKDISVGTTELVKLMPCYKKALKELTKVFEERKKRTRR